MKEEQQKSLMLQGRLAARAEQCLGLSRKPTRCCLRHHPDGWIWALQDLHTFSTRDRAPWQG